MIVQCEKCGAPLTVADGQRFVPCSYCGATTQVRVTTTVAARPRPAPEPVPYGPPPGEPSPRVARPPAEHPEKKSGGCGVLIAVLTMVFVGAVAGLVVYKKNGSFFAIHLDPHAPPTVATIPFGPASPTSVVLTGVAEGPISGSNVGPRCRGHFPVAPQYALRITSVQRVRLTTTGDNDVTMAVREPSGLVHCDDDSGTGSNPLLTLTLTPGVYPVWIGSYRDHVVAPFSFLASAEELGSVPLANGLAANSSPTLGVVSLAGPTTRATRAGNAGGSLAVQPLGSNCRGHVPPTPHLTLVTRDARRVTLTTRSSYDLTLVLRAADGTLSCDDDSGGAMQPRIERFLAPGVYQVWVGVFSGEAHPPFTLDVSSIAVGATASPTALSPSSEPTISAVDLDRAGPSIQLRGTAAGTLPASVAVPSCAGYVTASPQFRLTTGVARHVTIANAADVDLTLLLQGPGGEFVCGTASRTAPTYDFDVTAGQTMVWLGPTSRGSRPSFRVTVTTRTLGGGK